MGRFLGQNVFYWSNIQSNPSYDSYFYRFCLQRRVLWLKIHVALKFCEFLKALSHFFLNLKDSLPDTIAEIAKKMANFPAILCLFSVTFSLHKKIDFCLI